MFLRTLATFESLFFFAIILQPAPPTAPFALVPARKPINISPDAGNACARRAPPQHRRWAMVPEGPERKRIGDTLQLHARWTITNAEILFGQYRPSRPRASPPTRTSCSRP